MAQTRVKAYTVDGYVRAKIDDDRLFPALAGDAGDDSAAAENALTSRKTAEMRGCHVAVELFFDARSLVFDGTATIGGLGFSTRIGQGNLDRRGIGVGQGQVDRGVNKTRSDRVIGEVYEGVGRYAVRRNAYWHDAFLLTFGVEESIDACRLLGEQVLPEITGRAAYLVFAATLGLCRGEEED